MLDIAKSNETKKNSLFIGETRNVCMHLAEPMLDCRRKQNQNILIDWFFCQRTPWPTEHCLGEDEKKNGNFVRKSKVFEEENLTKLRK